MDSNNNFEYTEHSQRLDFYWQYLTAYFIVMLIYGIARGSIEEGFITMRWKDPVILLLFLFMLLSAVFLLYNFLKKKSVIVGKDFIKFRTRYKERTYKLEDISKIFIGKYSKRNMSAIYRVVKIKVKNRKYAIRFKPNAYWNDEELVKKVFYLKQQKDKKRNPA